MINLKFECPVAASLNQVVEGFNEELFKALKPPLLQLELSRFDGCKIGDEVHLKVGLGLKLPWISLITDQQNGEDFWFFIDEGKQLPPPLKKWKHIHKVQEREKGSLIVDDIYFTTNNAFLDQIMKPAMSFQFSSRYAVYQKVFGKLNSSP